MHQADKEIRILSDGQVELDNCPVSKQHNDKVRWVSETGPWTISFPENPFSRPATFSIGDKGGKSDWSRDVTGDVNRLYKYKVSGPGGTIDPNIIVK